MSSAPLTLRQVSIPRFALRRDEAAASLGVGVTKFDEWVHDGRMPQPTRVDGVVLWDTLKIQECWRAMQDGTVVVNPLDTRVL